MAIFRSTEISNLNSLGILPVKNRITNDILNIKWSDRETSRERRSEGGQTSPAILAQVGP